MSKWINHKYDKYRKRTRKKDCQELFNKFLAKELKERGIDIRMVFSSEAILKEIFWEIKNMQDWLMEEKGMQIRAHINLFNYYEDNKDSIDGLRKAFLSYLKGE
jgi:hypothetical protein